MRKAGISYREIVTGHTTPHQANSGRWWRIWVRRARLPTREDIRQKFDRAVLYLPLSCFDHPIV